MKPATFAVLSSGIFWQSPGLRQAGIDPDILYYRKRLPRLTKYDVIIVPKGLPEAYLRKIGPSLEQFLHDGGVILAFGEFRGQWHKGVEWVPALGPRQIKVTAEMAQLFPCPGACMSRRSLEPDSSVFPGRFEDWVLAPHGQYRKVPAGSIALAYPDVPNDPILQPVAFLQRYPGGGSLMAMTLDPDYHAYQGSDCAYCLLNMIVAWSKEAVQDSRQSRAMNAPVGGEWKRAVSDLFTRRRQSLRRNVMIGFTVGLVGDILVRWLA